MMTTFFQSLEPRCLLSLTPIGGATTVRAPDLLRNWDLAAADNGMFIVAAASLVPQPPGEPTETVRYTIVRYSASGQQLGAPLTIEQSLHGLGSGWAADLAVSMDEDGDAVLVYPAPAGGSDLGAIKVVRISKQGVMSPAFDAVAPVTSGGVAVTQPAVSMADDGRFFVAWLESRDSISLYHTVQVRAFEAAGAPRGPALTVDIGGPSTDFADVTVAANPDGSGAVVADYTAAGEGSSDVSFLRVTPTALIGERGNVGFDTQTTHPSVAVYDDNSFVVGYTRETGGPLGEPQRSYANYVTRFNAAGVAQGDEVLLAPSLAGDALDKHTFGLDLDATFDGGFVASFGQLVGDVETFYAQRYSVANLPEDVPTVVDIYNRGIPHWPSFEQGGPTHIAAAGDDIAIASWLIPISDVLKFQRLAREVDILLDRGSLTIFGTAGDDTLRVEAQAGNILVTRNDQTETFPAADVQFISINGFAGNDTITNDTSLPSTLSGGEGDDTIFAGGGADKVRGEAGRDSLWGRDGNDSIFGDDGVDSIYGNGGRDRIDGGANSDHIRGNAARDKLFGGHGNDRIYGSESGDWLYGGIGDDQLFGEGGNDLLFGDAGADTISGSAGDDVLFGPADAFLDHLFGDRGRDTSVGDQNDLVTGIEDARDDRITADA